MPKKSFSQNITSTQLMVKALNSRREALPVGVSTEIVEELNKLNLQAVEINAEQEKLKALLKEKTGQLDAVIKNLEQKYAFIKKYVKLGVPPELWREFGIEDKK